MSLCICAYQQRLQPENAYLSIDLQQTRELLQQLRPITARTARAQMLDACAQG
jgi:hypothetical protein